MAMEVEDALKGKKPKKYEEYDEVEEVDAFGQPTGKKVRVYSVPEHAEMVQRENWLEGRIRELERQENIAKVKVYRGRYDDVIGIEIIPL